VGDKIISLQDAVKANDVAALERLLDAGHDPNVGDPKRDPPLARADNPDVIALLLKRGACAVEAEPTDRARRHA
jgi:hypothetical protein